MIRSLAIQRINQEIGFRSSGNSLEPFIILMLQEAQRDLEKGKTLPRFLILEDQTLVLPAGSHSVALPTGFLRDVDDVGIRYFSQPGNRPRFLKRVYYNDGIEASAFTTESDPLAPDQPKAPKFYAIRNNTIDFIATVTTSWTFTWDYYKADAILSSEIENLWLANAADWLIGEAGIRLARSLRDQTAQASFDTMRTQGRSAVFAELLARELSSGPLVLGGSN